MNITLLRLRPLLREVRQLRSHVGRLADLYELDLASRGIARPGSYDPRDEMEVYYTDDEAEAVHEIKKTLGQADEDDKEDRDADE